MKNSVFFHDEWLIENLLNLLANREGVDGTQSYDVASGYAGYALVCIQASLYFADRNDDVNAQLFAAYARRELENAARAWSDAEMQTIGLLDGIAGYVWVLHLYEQFIADNKERSSRMAHNLCVILEDLLHSFLENGYTQQFADVISGFSGILSICKSIDLSYSSDVLDKVVEHIEASSLVGDDSLFLMTDDSPSETLRSSHLLGYVDLGVAHGLSGLLPRILSVRDGGLDAKDNEFLKQLLRLSCNSFPEGVWSVNDSLPEEKGPDCPVSSAHWCYGELSRIASILVLHDLGLDKVNREFLFSRLYFLAENGVLEKLGTQFADTGNFGLCHGLSGYVFTLMYLAAVSKVAGKSDIAIHFERVSRKLASELFMKAPYKDLQTEDCSYSGFLNGRLGMLAVFLAFENEKCFNAISIIFFGR